MSKGEGIPHIAENDYHDRPAAFTSTVNEKDEGTAYDRHEMSMLGKKQVLRRQFKFSTMVGIRTCYFNYASADVRYLKLGFASTVMVAWEFVLIVAPFGLTDGGTPAVFWGVLLSPCVLLPVYASLAEVASMSPTAGGELHCLFVKLAFFMVLIYH